MKLSHGFYQLMPQYSIKICVIICDSYFQAFPMKSLYCIFLILPFVLAACSAYDKASLSNFEEYEINSLNSENLVFVLKSHELHYTDIDRIDKNNFFSTGESTPYYSDSVIYETNIIIPRGAKGQCIHFTEEHIIIDFGEGVRLPFYITQEDNRAYEEIEIDGRIYRLIAGNQKARLFFDSGVLQGNL
jgi:hypothetical protein